MADILPPDGDLRRAIIISKANQLGLDLTAEVVEHIAESLTSNVRQLEGAVKMIVAYRDILNQHITIESVAKILQVFTK
jgi:chromosomal replication initiator protein